MGSIGRAITSCSRLSRLSHISVRHQHNVANQINRAIEKTVTNLFVGDKKENDFVFGQVHKKCDQLATIDTTYLPVDSELEQLLNRGHDDHEILQESFSSIYNHIKILNQQELATLLTRIKDRDSLKFRRLKRIIDMEFRWLFKNNVGTALMDLDLYFYVADLFYVGNINSGFVTALVQHLGRHDIPMTDEQFVHLLFLVIAKRQSFDILQKYEQRILRMLDTVRIDAVYIIALAYFKSSTRITNPEIFKKIVLRAIASFDEILFEQPGFCAIIKALRYSSKSVEVSHSRHYANQLMDTIINSSRYNEAMFASNFNTSQTLKFMEEFKIYKQDVLDDCRHHLFNNLDKYRYKDIQYCITSLSNLSYNKLHLDPSLESDFTNLSNLIIAHERSDLSSHGYHLFALMRAFAMFGYYNQKLMIHASNLLESTRQQQDMRNHLIEFDRTALLLHIAPRIEGCEFHLTSPLVKQFSHSMRRDINRPGPFLNSSIRSLDDILLRTRNSRFEDFNGKKYRKIAHDLLNDKRFNDSGYKLAFQYTMPHWNYADLVVSKGCREPGSFDDETLMPKQVPPDEKHCIIHAVRAADYCDPESTILCGYKRFSIRLLEKLGYKVVTVDLADPNLDRLISDIKSSLEG